MYVCVNGDFTGICSLSTSNQMNLLNIISLFFLLYFHLITDDCRAFPLSGNSHVCPAPTHTSHIKMGGHRLLLIISRSSPQ